MHGATGLLIKLGVRLVVFTAAFVASTRYLEGISVTKKWAYPVLGAMFSVLSTVFYWALAPVLDVATLNSLSFAIPLVANTVLLIAVIKVSNKIAERNPVPPPKKGQEKGSKPEKPRGWLRTTGFFASVWLALVLTAAHGVLWFALDYLPEKI